MRQRMISPTNQGVRSAIYMMYSFFSRSFYEVLLSESFSLCFWTLTAYYSANSLLKSLSRFHAKMAPSTPAENRVLIL